jgi:hypothetical protein
MFISLGFVVLGYADWMLVTPDFKGAPDFRFWIFLASYLLAAFGVIGFISSRYRQHSHALTSNSLAT